MLSAYSGASRSLTAGESTSRNRQSCVFPPLGARTAASRMRSCTAMGTGSGRTRRIALVVYRASQTSITRPPSVGVVPAVVLEHEPDRGENREAGAEQEQPPA